MAAISFIPLTPIRLSPPPNLHLQPKSPLSFRTMRKMRKRGDLLVSNAGGPPSSTSLIIAFILPLSLFAGTVFASIRIADDLEEKFLQDLAVNKALMEENDEKEVEEVREIGVVVDGSESRVMEVESEEEVAVPAAAPRTRSRPRRQG